MNEIGARGNLYRRPVWRQRVTQARRTPHDGPAPAPPGQLQPAVIERHLDRQPFGGTRHRRIVRWRLEVERPQRGKRVRIRQQRSLAFRSRIRPALERHRRAAPRVLTREVPGRLAAESGERDPESARGRHCQRPGVGLDAQEVDERRVILEIEIERQFVLLLEDPGGRVQREERRRVPVERAHFDLDFDGEDVRIRQADLPRAPSLRIRIGGERREIRLESVEPGAGEQDLRISEPRLCDRDLSVGGRGTRDNLDSTGRLSPLKRDGRNRVPRRLRERRIRVRPTTRQIRQAHSELGTCSRTRVARPYRRPAEAPDRGSAGTASIPASAVPGVREGACSPRP